MIYKLIYANRKEAITDLIAKNVIDKEENYINGTQAVVYLGYLTLQQETETTPAIIDTNYSIDLMSTNEIEFTNLIIPNNPRHGFAGN